MYLQKINDGWIWTVLKLTNNKRERKRNKTCKPITGQSDFAYYYPYITRSQFIRWHILRNIAYTNSVYKQPIACSLARFQLAAGKKHKFINNQSKVDWLIDVSHDVTKKSDVHWQLVGAKYSYQPITVRRWRNWQADRLVDRWQPMLANQKSVNSLAHFSVDDILSGSSS